MSNAATFLARGSAGPLSGPDLIISKAVLIMRYRNFKVFKVNKHKKDFSFFRHEKLEIVSSKYRRNAEFIQQSFVSEQSHKN